MEVLILESNLIWIGAGVLLTVLVGVGIRLVVSIRQPLAYIEVTPPAGGDRGLEATGKLFEALRGLGASRTRLEWVRGRRRDISCEVVATKAEGIRFLLCVPRPMADGTQQLVHSYLPSAKTREIADPLDRYGGDKHGKVLSFRQRGHYAFPIQHRDRLDVHDPVAYLAGVMTKLEAGEVMAMQLVIRPVDKPEATTLQRSILKNEDILGTLARRGSLLTRVIGIVNRVLVGVIDAVSIPGQSGHTAKADALHRHQAMQGVKPARTLSTFEQELIGSVHDKLSDPLLGVDIRVLVRTDDKTRRKRYIKNITSAMQVYTVPGRQSLDPVRPRYGIWRFWRRLQFRYRVSLPGSRRNVFSTAEAAGLFHFPNTEGGDIDNVVRSLSRTLPAPVSLKTGDTPDVIIGENRHHGEVTPIGLHEYERHRHMYIVGGTGNGKTTMLLYSIMQDIENGKGVAVIDPHGDLAETVLERVPEERREDVIYLNPDDISDPAGLNVLELPEGLEGDDLIREKDRVTESVISIMRKIFSEDDSGGHRVEYILRNTIQTALTLDNPTLFTVFELLNDSKFRNQVVAGLEDEDMKNFWQNELGKAGNFQKVKMTAGITAKIGRFLFSAPARRMLEQPVSTLDFDDIINSNKILVCNVSKGLLGEDTSTLLGTTALAKLQTAVLRRARFPESSRQPFYLYVDEFQDFATMSFVQLLSEARKYKLYLAMAEQSTAQQEQQRLMDIVLANVGTVICFRTGSQADEARLLPVFSPFIEQGEIANLEPYTFYIKITAATAQTPFSGVTRLLFDYNSYRTNRNNKKT